MNAGSDIRTVGVINAGSSPPLVVVGGSVLAKGIGVSLCLPTRGGLFLRAELGIRTLRLASFNVAQDYRGDREPEEEAPEDHPVQDVVFHVHSPVWSTP